MTSSSSSSATVNTTTTTTTKTTSTTTTTIKSKMSKITLCILFTIGSLYISIYFNKPTTTLTNNNNNNNNNTGRRRRLQASSPPPPSTPLNNFKDNWDPFRSIDHPVFWHIPKSGGSTVKNYLGSCYGMVLASEAGIQNYHDHDTRLKIIRNKGNNRFVNIDTTTPQGIQHAIELGYLSSTLADVTISPLLYEVETLFSSQKRGRVFAIFRDPIDRAISMYNYLQYAEWEPTYNEELKGMTLEEYATSDYVEDNMLTRTLTRKKRGELTEEDIHAATDVIRRKIMVGLMSRMAESLDRFEKFFDWHFHDATVQEECRTNLLANGRGNANRKKMQRPSMGSREYALLAKKNEFDLRVYAYVQTLFEEQEAFVQEKPNDYRLLPM